MKRTKNKSFLAFLLAVLVAVFTWSAIKPRDYLTWFLEIFPVLIGLAVLVPTYKRFPLTRLTYVLILLHSIILMVGGHYTYAEVPFGEWARDVFHMQRNNYDKLGHFAQGFIPAIIIREVVVRNKVMNSRGWRNFFIVCACMAISAFYELLEWFVAVVSGTAAEAFLGSQGYVWDTQSDMWYATLGAIISLAVFARVHDRQMRELY